MTDRASWVGPGVLLVFLTALVSGVSTFVNAFAVQGASSDAFVTIRNLVVAAALVPVALVTPRALRAPSLRLVDWARLVSIGLLGGAIPFLLFFHGLELAARAGGAATASFGYRTLFLWAGVLAVVGLRERLPRRALLAAGLLLAGNGLLLALTSPIWTDGTAYVLAATGLWAVEYTLSKRTLHDLAPATVAAGRMGFGALFLAGYLGFTAQWGHVADFSGGDWAWVGISAAFLLAFVACWYTGLQRVDLGSATSVLVLGFPITWCLGVLVQGQGLSLESALGALAVVLGAVIAVGSTAFRATRRYLSGVLRPSVAAT